jgi:prepilin-type N-terminal cleavage/methylation domain-containing protein
MIKKLGFTITEILLTLGIIGVVSALAIPAFTTDIQKQVWANSLAANQTKLEKAFQHLIAKEVVMDLTKTTAWNELSANESGALLDNTTSEQTLKDFAEATNILTSTGQSVADYYGDIPVYNINNSKLTIANDNELKSMTSFEMDTGAAVFLYINHVSKLDSKSSILNMGGNLYQKLANVAIDVNGKKKPNKIGRDIFFFALSPDGELYPFGGNDYGAFFTQATWYNWKIYCSDSSKFFEGKHCTARLIENNYKFDY